MGKREDDIQSGYDAAAAQLGQASGDVAAALEPIEERFRRIPPTLRPSTSDPIFRRVADPPYSPRERAEALVKALPATVRIGPHDYSIVLWSIEEANERDLRGQTSHTEMEIRLAPNFATPSLAADYFLHEVLHGLWTDKALADDDKEERIVTTLATGLVGLFRDNPWLTGWIASAVRGV